MIPRRPRLFFLVSMMALMGVAGVVSLAPCRADYTNEWIADVQTRLESADPVAQRKAIAEIDQFLVEVPASAAAQLNARWLKSMIAAALYPDAIRLTRAAMLAIPHDADNIDALLRWRIDALQKSGQPRAALADARLLFEICPMARTESALLLVAECLNRAYLTDPTIVNRFIHQQLAGAQLPPSLAPPAAQPDSLLRDISVDRKPYKDALDQLNIEIGPDPQRFVDLASQGNLLILAGRPADAQLAFEKLKRLVDYDQLRNVDDALARVYKAQDLSIGRANAYVQSLKKALTAEPPPPAHH